jgi:hypothetical protein
MYTGDVAEKEKQEDDVKDLHDVTKRFIPKFRITYKIKKKTV